MHDHAEDEGSHSHIDTQGTLLCLHHLQAGDFTSSLEQSWMSNQRAERTCNCCASANDDASAFLYGDVLGACLGHQVACCHRGRSLQPS